MFHLSITIWGAHYGSPAPEYGPEATEINGSNVSGFPEHKMPVLSAAIGQFGSAQADSELGQ